jgi:hypothetical protein
MFDESMNILFEPELELRHASSPLVPRSLSEDTMIHTVLTAMRFVQENIQSLTFEAREVAVMGRLTSALRTDCLPWIHNRLQKINVV